MSRRPAAVTRCVRGSPCSVHWKLFQKAVRVFRPDPYRPAPGVHPSATVAPDAELGEQVAIGAHCVVEARSQVEAHAVPSP